MSVAGLNDHRQQIRSLVGVNWCSSFHYNRALLIHTSCWLGLTMKPRWITYVYDQVTHSLVQKPKASQRVSSIYMECLSAVVWIRISAYVDRWVKSFMHGEMTACWKKYFMLTTCLKKALCLVYSSMEIIITAASVKTFWDLLTKRHYCYPKNSSLRQGNAVIPILLV